MRFKNAVLAVLLCAWLPASVFSAREKKADPSLRGEIYTHFLNALLLESNGKLDQALKEYDRTLELNPAATLIYRQRANLYLKMGNSPRALADAQAYVRSHPQDIEALVLLANIHLMMGQGAAARQVLEKVLQEKPDHAESLLTLATLESGENPARAIDLLQRLVRADPLAADGYYYLGLIYQKQGDLKKSKEMFEKVIQLDSDSLPSLVLLGQMSENANDAAGALRYYGKALEKAPDNFALRMQLVLLEAQKMDFAEIDRLLKPYENDPDAPVEANLWMGIVAESRKNWPAALKYYEKAEKQSSSAELLIRLASIHSQLGDTKQAFKDLRELVRRFPDNPQYRYFLGLAYIDVKQPRKALREFDGAIRLRKDFAQAYFQKGVAFDSLGKWDQAESMFRETVHYDSANASAYNYLGYTYANRNERLPEARRLIEQALTLDHDNPAFLDSLGWLYYREGDYKQALSNLKGAAQGMSDPTIFAHLGECYEALKDWPAAAVSFAKALELDPDNKEVKKKLAALNRRLVPTSPARKTFDEARAGLGRVANLSGGLLLTARAGYGGLIPAGSSQGFFYLRKENPVPGASTRTATDLRVDLMGVPLAPALTLRYSESPRAQWSMFPPELRGQVPAETEGILEALAAYLDGDLLREFDSPETEVEDKRGCFLLANRGRTLRLDKEDGRVTEFSAEGRSIEVEKFQKAGGLWLPEKMRLRWAGGAAGPLREVEIEFSKLSLDAIEARVFEGSR